MVYKQKEGGHRGRSNGRRGAAPQGRRGNNKSRNKGGGRRNGGERIPVERFINKNPKQNEQKEEAIVHTFADFGFSNKLQIQIDGCGFSSPTAIQDKAIPHIMEEHDIVGLANTGTGKTAAFLLPLIDRKLRNPEEKTIILAPTRELAVQINEELRMFTRGMNIGSTACVGGAPIRPQIKNVTRNNDFIIGTPGRVMDLMKRKAFDLSEITTVVFDEGDRMLDMGFVDDMRYIISHVPNERNTLLFSATISKDIEQLINEFLSEPVRVSVVHNRTNSNIAQDVVRLQGRDKTEVLAGLLEERDLSKVLVFGRTKRGVDRLSRDLDKRGVKVESIHGDKSHGKRKRSLDAFKKERVQVLVATDVAARGIDVSEISHVINYDIPETYDDYIHRIGRTGRGDHEGQALTFVA